MGETHTMTVQSEQKNRLSRAQIYHVHHFFFAKSDLNPELFVFFGITEYIDPINYMYLA